MKELKESNLKTLRFLNKAISFLWELCLKAYFRCVSNFESFQLQLLQEMEAFYVAVESFAFGYRIMENYVSGMTLLYYVIYCKSIKFIVNMSNVK